MWIVMASVEVSVTLHKLPITMGLQIIWMNRISSQFWLQHTCYRHVVTFS